MNAAIRPIDALRRRHGDVIVYAGVRYPAPGPKPKRPPQRVALIERDWLFVASGAQQQMRPTVKQITEIVGEHFGFTRDELCSRQRDTRSVLARHVAFYLARSMTRLSLPKLGMMFGGRDHTTILNGNARICLLIESDIKIAATVKMLRERIELASHWKPDRAIGESDAR